MAQRVTMVYKAFHELYNDDYAEELAKEDPLSFPGLEVIEHHNESRKIDHQSGAKVIIAGNGMMSGGKILNHAIEYLPRKTTRLLIVGYQAENTYGRLILEGQRNLTIDNVEVHMRATVTEIKGLSAHADQEKLVRWVEHIKNLQHVVLVHGEEEARHALAQKIIEKNPVPQIHLPLANEEISF
jgi:metallo-beta-lactamase family protein